MRSPVVLLMLILVFPPLFAQDPLAGLRGPEKLEVLIDEVVKHQRTLTSLCARFHQEKNSPLLLETVVSEGDFLFKAPDKVRWNYTTPEEMTVLFSGTRLETYRGTESEPEVIEVSRKNRRFVRVLAGTLPLDEISSQFSITLNDPGAPEPYELLLEPSHRALSRRLDHIRLEIDRQLLLPVGILWKAADGSMTRYRFTDLKIDCDIRDEDFRIESVGQDADNGSTN